MKIQATGRYRLNEKVTSPRKVSKSIAYLWPERMTSRITVDTLDVVVENHLLATLNETFFPIEKKKFS